jgi:hypothetical protein
MARVPILFANWQINEIKPEKREIEKVFFFRLENITRGDDRKAS